jgi:ketosteroid isomerase-like protein
METQPEEEDLPMRRRAFLGSSVASVITGSLATRLEATAHAVPATEEQADRALAALNAARSLEVQGNYDGLMNAYHSDAVLLDPALARPAVGRAAIVQSLREVAPRRKMEYYYYRQPQVVQAGNAAVVVANYEAGYRVENTLVEDSGKTSNVVLLGPTQPLVAQEVHVPNISAGSYGARGTALTRPRFGRFPLRALGPPPFRAPTTAGGGEADVLFNLVKQIHRAWVAGRTDEILGLSNPVGTFLIGDYSPFYITGATALREHFNDFYATGGVTSIQELNPVVRIWGSMAAVAFDFDLDYRINNQQRRAPGRGVYTFVRSGQSTRGDGAGFGGARADAQFAAFTGATQPAQFEMAVCTASHIVGGDMGDPYTTGE